jgi:hypothetical protein
MVALPAARAGNALTLPRYRLAVCRQAIWMVYAIKTGRWHEVADSAR